MKRINTYINERLHITSKQQYSCQPKTKDELKEIIIQRIEDDGLECDLNDIDVSNINDMSGLFNASDNKIFENFNGDISQWNVSNVTNMKRMFYWCYKFNGDISGWNVSNVKDMDRMFCKCEKFNCDLSAWNVSNVETMELMFFECEAFNCDISKWDVSNVKSMHEMFYGCEKFNCDLSGWDVSNVMFINHAFHDCPTKPKWYKK